MIAAGREIRALDEFQQRGVAGVRILDQRDGRGAQFAQIVRRDRGRHADRDAVRTVGQQIGKGGGKNDGLFLHAVISVAEIDGVFVQAFEQRLSDLGQPALGVAHRGGVIAVHIAEIALAFHQRIAHREILRQAHQRLIDRLIAVRMIFADDVADHAGAFLEAGRRIEAEQTHGMQQPAVDGLQPVAGIGQRALGDGGERISEIALASALFSGSGRMSSLIGAMVMELGLK